MAEQDRIGDSGTESEVFATDPDTERGTRNRSHGETGGIHSLRNTLNTRRAETNGTSGNAAADSNEPATKRKYTRRNRTNETVAAWGELIGQGLGAWTDVLAESRGNHWRIKQERLNTVGEKYAALLVHYFPESGGEMSLWGAALMATGTTLGPPLAKDAMDAVRKAQQQVRQRPQPQPPPFWQQRPPVNQDYYEPPPYVQPEPFITPPPSWGTPPPNVFGSVPPSWEAPEPEPDVPRPLTPIQMMPAEESQDAIDLKSIGQAMGLSDEQIAFAMNTVQAMMGETPQ